MKPQIDEIERIKIFYLILEDRRYFCHNGFDIISVTRAILKSFFGYRICAISTIEQQLVRTKNNHKERTFSRKLREISHAIEHANRFSKEQNLCEYLDTAYFGWNIKGINQLTEKINARNFGCPEKLTASWYASMLLYPMPRHPNKFWTEKVYHRAKYGFEMRDRIRHTVSFGPWSIGFSGSRPIIVSTELRRRILSLDKS
ncbi:transglycosylase domain-containing protein [Thalassobaculum sp.]|uniref:transglycosylase domain-containing protein n=1 Tax=Thalassobaculum sp. TaxID=2022740 RepID=UPI0032EFF6B1